MTPNVRFTDITVDESLADRVKDFSADQGISYAETTRRALALFVREPPPYQFAGRDGPSLVLDLAAVNGLTGVDPVEADERIKRFAAWSQDVAVRFQGTGDLSQVVPPGYRTVTELVATADRPLVAASERGTIADASPFNVPDVTSTGATGDHVEGTNPTPGTLASSTLPVEPQAVSGILELTREVVDAASPSGDLIALQAMREDYGGQVERRVYEELNTAQAGVITAGFAPSGAQVSTSVASALGSDLRKALARFAHVRLRKPRNAVAGEGPTEILANQLAVDQPGDAAAMWRVMGVAVNPSTHPVATGAGDHQVSILGTGDLWVWESPTLQFRYDQKSGPGVVELVTWGYVGVRLVRPRGLHAIRWSAA